MLGKYLMASIPEGFEAISTRYQNINVQCQLQMDITSKLSVQRAFYVYKPDIVIHTAAIGAVDYCQKHKDEAEAVNIIGTKNVAAACRDFGAKMVLISTNAVFDGTNPPYNEESLRHPLSMYGETKVRAEGIVGDLENSLIVRTARLFGVGHPGGRRNWIDILGDVEPGKQMKITTEDIANPTYALDLAAAIWKLLQDDRSGLYHVTGSQAVTMYDFAYQILKEVYNTEPEAFILPVTSTDMPAGVMVRPADTTFDLSKLNAAGIHTLTLNRALWLVNQEIFG